MKYLSWVAAGVASVCSLMVLSGSEKAEQAEEVKGWQHWFKDGTTEGFVKRGYNGLATYEVVDGVLVGTTVEGSKNTFLCKGPFKNFELEFETWVDENLNSGVQIRSQIYEEETPHPRNPKKMVPKGTVFGMQCEIPKSAKRIDTAGNFWDEFRKLEWWDDFNEKEGFEPVFKPGEWNHYRIKVVGDHFQTWVNGKACADFKNADPEDQDGFIGFQVHGIPSTEGPYEVKWRKVKFRELP